MIKILIFFSIRDKCFSISLLCLCSFIILFTGCIAMVEQKEWQSVKVRIPYYPEAEVVYTNKEYVSVRVKKGECLSRVIQRVFSRYLMKKGYSGTYNFSKTLYSVIRSMPKTALKSRNKNLIYAGEVIKFRLPYQIDVIKRFDYYLSSKRIYGLDKVKAILDFKWLVDYKENYFDCTERSAFVEYLLENEGFNAEIVENINHCWVIVEVEPGKFVHVEAVASPPYVIDNKQYLFRYSSIYEAIHSNAAGYDWWNVTKKNKFFIARRVTNY